MEFDGVLLFDFFKASSCAKQYAGVYSYLRGQIERAVAVKSGQLKKVIKQTREHLSEQGGGAGGTRGRDGQRGGTCSSKGDVVSDAVVRFKAELHQVEVLLEHVDELAEAAGVGKAWTKERGPPPDALFSSELKNLYVAATRPRNNLVIFETSDAFPVRAISDLAREGHAVLCEARTLSSSLEDREEVSLSDEDKAGSRSS